MQAEPQPVAEVEAKGLHPLEKPISFASGKARAILSLATRASGGRSLCPSTRAAFRYAVRCGAVARPTLNVR